MLIARHFVVRGRVQGVGYRHFVDRAAHREGLSGWVRNLSEGGVEVQAEGDAEAVDRFELALRRGPPGARVDVVDVTDLQPSGRATGFMVRSTM